MKLAGFSKDEISCSASLPIGSLTHNTAMVDRAAARSQVAQGLPALQPQRGG
jgi:hypothetical protein